MKKAVEEGRFREDLYYRLAETGNFTATVKRLQGRHSSSCRFFRKEHSYRIHVQNEGFTEEAKACMLGYDWPGNVRELSAKVKRAVIVADNVLLDVCDLGLDNVVCGVIRKFISFRKGKGYEICWKKITAMSARQLLNWVVAVQLFIRK